MAVLTANATQTRLMDTVRGNFSDTFPGFVGNRTNHEMDAMGTKNMQGFPMKTPFFNVIKSSIFFMARKLQ